MAVFRTMIISRSVLEKYNGIFQDRPGKI